MTRFFFAIAAGGLALASSGCDSAQPAASSDAREATAAMLNLGCGTCHTIPGVTGADGRVGPSLEHVGSQIYIAGMLRNNPENLQYWISHPQSVVPGNIMPDIPMSDASAAKIAGYLEMLR
jgi:cytochrome c1